MTEAAYARLLHDVGKYVCRIARNVPPEGPVVEALVPLLIKDLFDLPSGVSASARFEALATELPAAPELDAARRALRTIDELEPRVRAADQEACLVACAAAREVEAQLRVLAQRTRTP